MRRVGDWSDQTGRAEDEPEDHLDDHAGVDAEHWWAGATRGVATIGYILERLDDDSVARMKIRYDELSAPYVDSDGFLSLPVTALLAAGTRG